MAAAYLTFLVLQGAALVPAYLALRPSAGSILNGIVGALGLVCMIAMHVYSIARRSSALRRRMRLSWWLHLHIYLGLQGILLTYVHCLPLLWRHGPPMLLNPGMLDLYALTIVFASGVFGRYLYAWMPKTASGHVEGPGGDGARPVLRRLFAAWIFVHRPLAAALYVITFVHVVLGALYNPWSEWIR